MNRTGSAWTYALKQALETHTLYETFGIHDRFAGAVRRTIRRAENNCYLVVRWQLQDYTHQEHIRRTIRLKPILRARQNAR
jgi:activator of HSP90 ATPase